MDSDGPIIKSDPDDGSLSPIADDDQYEDTGELELPKDLPQAWMIKVPDYLYETWSGIADDQPVQLGVVRRFASGKRKIILDPTTKYTKNIPHEYDMNQAPTHGNTFIFSEKDQPNHKRRRIMNDEPDPNGLEKRQTGRSWRSKTIPKKTSLAAVASKEAQWLPVDNEQFRRVTDQRAANEKRKNPGVNIYTDPETDAMAFGGAVLDLEYGKPKKRDGGFGNFVSSAPVVKSKRPKDKAHRMDENDLTELLTNLFQEYEYYHLSTLKTRTRQPEAYIRQLLGRIAEYVPAGDHAGTFRLNADTRNAMKMGAGSMGAAAPKLEDYQSGTDFVTEDDLEMEDVKT